MSLKLAMKLVLRAYPILIKFSKKLLEKIHLHLERERGLIKLIILTEKMQLLGEIE